MAKLNSECNIHVILLFYWKGNILSLFFVMSKIKSIEKAQTLQRGFLDGALEALPISVVAIEKDMKKLFF